MGNKTVKIVLSTIVLVLAISSGWIYSVYQNKRTTILSEQAIAQETFARQYGDKANITRWVTSDKVYAAQWTGEDGVTYISWSVGGLWVTVYRSKPVTEPVPTP